MSAPHLIAAEALAECKVVRSGHRKGTCARCKGLGFRWVRYWPCHRCGGTGHPIARMDDCATKLERLIGQLDERIEADQILLGLEVPGESVDERLRRVSHRARKVR